MILLILFIVGMIASWIFFGYAAKNGNDGLGALFLMLSLSFTVASITGICVWGCQSGDAQTVKVDRDFYQDVIYNLSDNMSFETVGRVIKRSKEINERIETDRRHCNNSFYGTFYNNKIAEIELIDIPELHLKDFSQTIYGEKEE